MVSLREVHCGSTEDDNLFSSKLSPTLPPSLSPKSKASDHSQPSLLVGIGFSILFLAALVVIVILVYQRQKNPSTFTNNPIHVRSDANPSFPNYGTFSA